MRLLLIQPSRKTVHNLGECPSAAPQPLAPPEDDGFYWLSAERPELEVQLPAVQALLQQLCGTPLVDLHVSDLLNAQIPSTFDFTSDYDVMLFRRLRHFPRVPEQNALQPLETVPVGYAVFDQLLLSIHPPACALRAQSMQRLLEPGKLPEKRSIATRLPPSSADLMLRQLDQMIDGYQSLRRDMARQLDIWQMALLNPRSRFSNWTQILQARLSLHQLDEICEDQRAAVQDWIDTLRTWQHTDSGSNERHALELLLVRSRDVLEHIERVIHHVHRMEQSAEVAVQLHFSAQSNRTNDIMRVLTTLTAIFLPLNLIAAIFGMNFDVLPLVHEQDGFWWAMGGMLSISLVLLVFFWRRRFIEKDSLMGTPYGEKS